MVNSCAVCWQLNAIRLLVEIVALCAFDANSVGEILAIGRGQWNTITLRVKYVRLVAFNTDMHVVKAFAVDIVAVNDFWVGFADSLIVCLILRPVVVWTFSVDRISIFPSVSITVKTLYALTVLCAPCFAVIVHSNAHVLLSVIVCSWDTLEASLSILRPLGAVGIFPAL